MRNTVLQQAKALEKARLAAARGAKKMPPKREVAQSGVNWSERGTGQPAPAQPNHAPDIHRDDPMLTTRELGTGFRKMAPAGGALAAGLAAATAASKGGGIRFQRPASAKPAPVNGGQAMFNYPDVLQGGGPPKKHKVGDSYGGGNGSGITVIEMPTVVGTIKHGTAPKMWAKANRGDVEVTVEHTEYLQDVIGTGSTVFPGSDPLQFFANPGQVHSFPWLSTLAQNFDEYKFDKLELSYEPAVGTDADGKLLCTFDPDVLDEFPDTKQELLQARVQLDAMPWNRSKLVVPSDLLSEYRFVRPASLPAGADQHVYDAGVFNMCAPGAPATMIGEVFVTYKVRLRTPNGGAITEGQVTVIGAANATPMGTSLSNAGNLHLVWESGTQFKFDTPGTYYLEDNALGTNFTGGQDITAEIPAAGPLNTVTAGVTAFTAVQAIRAFEITVANVQGTFLYDNPVASATFTSHTLRIWKHDLDLSP